jgi:hypothetical protein
MTIGEGVGFTTKETPENEHTKASLKVKGVLRIVTYEHNYIEAFVE